MSNGGSGQKNIIWLDPDGGDYYFDGIGHIAETCSFPDNPPRGVGMMPLFFGCIAFGASWYKARLASTATFDLKQKVVTITPMWHLGRKKTYRFEEIVSLRAIKHFIEPNSFIGRQWWYDYWSFSLVLRNNTKLKFGEGYPPGRHDKYINTYTDTISSSTGISSE